MSEMLAEYALPALLFILIRVLQAYRLQRGQVHPLLQQEEDPLFPLHRPHHQPFHALFPPPLLACGAHAARHMILWPLRSTQIAASPLAEVLASVDAKLSRENNRIDVLMLSGGEPTLYPWLEQLLEQLVARPIVRILINSNGLRIANDDAFVETLKKYRERVEIYLQYDGEEPESSRYHRGADIRRFKARALDTMAQTIGVLEGEVVKSKDDVQVPKMSRHWLALVKLVRWHKLGCKTWLKCLYYVRAWRRGYKPLGRSFLVSMPRVWLIPAISRLPIYRVKHCS